MNREQIESAFAKSMEHALEVIGNTTAVYLPILGGKSIELSISCMEEYLKMLKELQHDYENTATSQSCMSPMHNDSMLIHRNRLSRTSKARLTVFRASPEAIRASGSPMEIDMQSVSHIDAIVEESSVLDPSIMMGETTHQRGFLADVSELNGTVRTRNPSFNFNYLSPVASEKSRRASIIVRPMTDTTSDFDDSFVEAVSRTISIRRPRAHAGGEALRSIFSMNSDELKTPRAHNMTIDLTDSDATPTNLNLWNVKLRPGSNRKIDNEIRNEIQRQLARDAEVSNQQ
ncbi:hypothetical protein CAEBREN_10849 [Caenorhabditis brenneri]|uniref:Uncharacterized protein n=1 Tax=Caenorhabditis brenneri TaxID=135651 RepID=G0MF96_CAEBE|nr:hypothetical protein CAEBREN_10849 [Caenorhabditis brenneri]